MCGLAYQMTRLTIAQGSQNRKLAEEALTEGNLIPTIRAKSTTAPASGRWPRTRPLTISRSGIDAVIDGDYRSL